jgi:hypothetical protein
VFAPGSVHVGFVVDKVALGQVFFSKLFCFPCRYHSTVALSTHISSEDRKRVGWKPQFRDIVPPHRHKQPPPPRNHFSWTSCVNIRNLLILNGDRPPLTFSCPTLLMQCIRSQPPYLDTVSLIRSLRTRHSVATVEHLTWKRDHHI